MSAMPRFANTNLNEKSRVADFVSTAPMTSRVFERYQIDFCCGGNVSLDTVCKEKHLDASSLLTELKDSVTHCHAGKDKEEKDWTREEDLNDIMDHILDVYHDPLRPELTRLEGVMGKAVRKHGENLPELKQMEEILDALFTELRMHLQRKRQFYSRLCATFT